MGNQSTNDNFYNYNDTVISLIRLQKSLETELAIMFFNHCSYQDTFNHELLIEYIKGFNPMTEEGIDVLDETKYIDRELSSCQKAISCFSRGAENWADEDTKRAYRQAIVELRRYEDALLDCRHQITNPVYEPLCLSLED